MCRRIRAEKRNLNRQLAELASQKALLHNNVEDDESDEDDEEEDEADAAGNKKLMTIKNWTMVGKMSITDW